MSLPREDMHATVLYKTRFALPSKYALVKCPAGKIYLMHAERVTPMIGRTLGEFEDRKTAHVNSHRGQNHCAACLDFA